MFALFTGFRPKFGPFQRTVDSLSCPLSNTFARALTCFQTLSHTRLQDRANRVPSSMLSGGSARPAERLRFDGDRAMGMRSRRVYLPMLCRLRAQPAGRVAELGSLGVIPCAHSTT